MDERRPDPEELLKQIKQEEIAKQRGKLKIFFGYAAGVGKTYAMLEAAHVAYHAGVDVVAGYVEISAYHNDRHLFLFQNAIKSQIDFKDIYCCFSKITKKSMISIFINNLSNFSFTLSCCSY